MLHTFSRVGNEKVRIKLQLVLGLSESQSIYQRVSWIGAELTLSSSSSVELVDKTASEVRKGTSKIMHVLEILIAQNRFPVSQGPGRSNDHLYIIYQKLCRYLSTPSVYHDIEE